MLGDRSIDSGIYLLYKKNDTKKRSLCTKVSNYRAVLGEERKEIAYINILNGHIILERNIKSDFVVMELSQEDLILMGFFVRTSNKKGNEQKPLCLNSADVLVKKPFCLERWSACYRAK